tara:strand:+ start:1072 stop:2625 length:1554 start_codon:yes stop_codon:yes gene_type:complete
MWPALSKIDLLFRGPKKHKTDTNESSSKLSIVVNCEKFTEDFAFLNWKRLVKVTVGNILEDKDPTLMFIFYATHKDEAEVVANKDEAGQDWGAKIKKKNTTWWYQRDGEERAEEIVIEMQPELDLSSDAYEKLLSCYQIGYEPPQWAPAFVKSKHMSSVQVYYDESDDLQQVGSLLWLRDPVNIAMDTRGSQQQLDIAFGRTSFLYRNGSYRRIYRTTSQLAPNIAIYCATPVIPQIATLPEIATKANDMIQHAANDMIQYDEFGKYMQMLYKIVRGVSQERARKALEFMQKLDLMKVNDQIKKMESVLEKEEKKVATIHVINSIGYAFDDSSQPDANFFCTNMIITKIDEYKVAVQKIVHKIIKCAEHLKLKRIMLAEVGCGFFAGPNQDLAKTTFYKALQECTVESNDFEFGLLGKGITTNFLKNAIGESNEIRVNLRKHTFFDGVHLFPNFVEDKTQEFLNETLFVNAWDPHSVAGNGNGQDNSLDGFFGRSTAIAALSLPQTNPYILLNWKSV